MSQSHSHLGDASGLARVPASFMRAPDRATLVAALEEYLHETTQARAMQLLWRTDGSTQALFATQPHFGTLNRLERLQLAAGHPAEAGEVTYVPMLVLGELRGWVALEAAQASPPVAEAVEQAGLALALLERQAAQTAASREIAALHKIGQMVATTLELDELLPNVSQLVRELVAADDFYIALVDPETERLRMAYLTTEQGTVRPTETWPLDTGLIGQIISSGAPIVTDDYRAECERRGIQPLSAANLAFSYAWVGVPLSHHDHIFGAMVASMHNRAVRYGDADVHLLAIVAAHAAAAVANAQLYKQVQEQASQLALINRIGRTIAATLDPHEVPMLIMNELKAALDVEDGAVLIEPQRNAGLRVRFTLEPKRVLQLPPGAGIAGAALQHQQVLVVNDVAADPRRYEPFDIDDALPTRSLICAPLNGRRQLRGVIQLRNKRGGPFTAADAQLLEAVAEQAATALENAELYFHTDNALGAHIADLEQRNHQLTNIVAISNALRSTNDVREICQQTAETIHRMIRTPRVVVGLLENKRQAFRAVAQIGLDTAITRARRERWTPVGDVLAMLNGAQQITTVSYHVGQHALAPGFEDCILMALLDSTGRLMGLIGFDTPAASAPLSDALLGELEIVANQAAIAIVNARLASEQEQTVDRLTALNALSLAVTTTTLSTDEIMQMTVGGALGTTNGIGGGWAVLGRDDKVRRQSTRLDVDVALLTPLLENVTEDYAEFYEDQIPAQLADAGVQSLVVVPVRGAKLTLGAFWIGYGDSELASTEREMVVLYAKTAGAVLENLRLFDQVSSAHGRLASILESTAEGMLMATAQGKIAAANTALRQLLGLDDQVLEDRSVFDVCNHFVAKADQDRVHPMCEALMNVASGDWPERGGELSLTSPIARDLAWNVMPVRGTMMQQSAALLVLRDVTAERQAEKLRQDLSNMIVHDLRAPLTNMIVSNDLLLKQISGPLTAAQQRILQIAGTSSQQMLDLVNALLDIRRLEQRQLEIQRQPVELFEIVEAVTERLERVAEERQVRIVNATAPLPPISADVDLLRRVVQNLVDNATKFSPRGGTVSVGGAMVEPAALPASHAPGRWLVVDIADEGTGVPEAYRSMIFELFSQAPTGRGQGTGLGLAFCKLAVAAHGGMIWVEDGSAGGAVFRFSIPLAG